MNSIIEAAPPAFFKHNHENERVRREVTRSSAVFYFGRSDDFRTQLLYMNYWREKRGLDNVTRRITLRTMGGEIFHRTEVPVVGQGAHSVEINDLLDGIEGAPTEGSFEVEFLSDTNMAIAYPAAIVRYIGDDWHSVAHSSQRYFSETSGDDPEMVGRVQMAEEGNLSIADDPRADSFLIVHNGPVAVPATPIQVAVYAEDGRSTSVQTDPVAWAPYQTRILRLSELVDYRAFLQGARGTFDLKFPIGGIFPRLIGGLERDGAWSIDHSNFAATTGPAADDVIPVDGRAGFKDLVFNLPNNLAQDWECFADIYPTYPSGRYGIELRYLDAEGHADAVEAIPVERGAGNSFPRIRVDNKAAGEGRNVELLFRHDREVPRRFHVGIHYRIGDGLPGFLTDGPLPHSTAPIRTRWFPVFEPTDNQNYLMIANRTIGDEPAAAVEYAIKLFNSFGDDPLVSRLVLEKCESTCLPLSALIPGAEEFLRGRPGWVYMTASEPQRSVIHYASVRGGKSIAVCHAF